MRVCTCSIHHPSSSTKLDFISLYRMNEWMNQDQCFGSVVAKRWKRRREGRDRKIMEIRFIQNEWMNRIKHNSKQYIINQSTQIHLQVPVPHPSTLTALSTTIPRSQTFTIRSRQHKLVYGRKSVTENCREPHPIDIAWKQYTRTTYTTIHNQPWWKRTKPLTVTRKRRKPQ